MILTKGINTEQPSPRIHIYTHTHTVKAIVNQEAENASNPIYKDKGRHAGRTVGLSQFGNHNSGQVPGSHRTPQIAGLAPSLAGGPVHGTFPTRLKFSSPSPSDP